MKTAIVTGGSGGIGSAIVKKLGENGYATAIVYNSNEKTAFELQREVKNSIAVKCDVSSEDEALEMPKKVMSNFGRIDVLVNGASPALAYSKFIEKNMKNFVDNMNINYFGAVNCIKNVLPHMSKQKSGSIINILTENTLKPQPGFSDYISAKYALLGLTRCLALEYASKNIRINAISPGMVETNMIKNLPPKAIELAKETSPLGRLTTADDVANAVIFLISENASNITGINLPVCGGNVI